MTRQIEEIRGALEGRNFCVAVSGKSGCGNTTTSKLLANTLGIRLINYTFRSLAQERGVSMDEIIREAAVNDEIDKHIDRRQVELASEGSCVLASRLAIWMKKDAHLKVYLTADPAVRSARIHQREGGALEDIIAHTSMRDSEDHRRYNEIYGINNDDYSFADLVLDAGSHTPDQLVAVILEKLHSMIS